jgi:hypothetical protein
LSHLEKGERGSAYQRDNEEERILLSSTLINAPVSLGIQFFQLFAGASPHEF